MTDINVTEDVRNTGAGVIQFLDFVINKGYVKNATGNAMKTAVREVLSTTEGEEWERIDVRQLDVEDVSSRFATKKSHHFSTASLNTYIGRFKKAVGMYLEHAKDPANWKPDIKPRTTKASAARSATNVSEQTPDQQTSVNHQTPIVNRVDMIPYPFPLRDGVRATLTLPVDLTPREAKRIAAFIETVAIDEVPALPPGSAPEAV